MQEITLEKALEHAKKNPNSEFARSMRATIETGSLDATAARQGLTLPGQFERERTATTMGPNNFYEEQETQKPRGFFSKAKDFVLDDLVGVGDLLRGTSTALATSDSRFAKGVRGVQSFVSGEGFDTRSVTDLSNASMEQTRQQQDRLIEAIRQAQAEGRPTESLERQLRLNQASMQDASRIQTDLLDAAPTDKEIKASAARTMAAVALPKVTGGVSKVLGGTKAATTLGAAAKGAKVGAVTGAIEGGVHGGATAYGDERSVVDGAVSGAVAGAAGGAVVGGTLNAALHKVAQRSANGNLREGLKKAVSSSDVDAATLQKTRTDILNSQAFPIDESIRAGDVAADAVYSDPLKKTLTANFAQGRIDDVAQKLSSVDESLADDFLSKIDINNTTMDEIVEAGVETLDNTKNNPYNLNNVLMKAEKGQNGKIKVVPDKAAKTALKGGVGKHDIALVKGTVDTADGKKVVSEMLDAVQDTIDNPRTATRYSIDPVADLAVEQYVDVHKALRSTGDELDTIARGLQGSQANFDSAIDDFVEQLQKAGVELVEEGDSVTLNFNNSDFKRAGKPTQRFLQEQIDDLIAVGDDAYKGHQMKRGIDNALDYGKSSNKGLVRQAENMVKQLRHNVDDVLDTSFPDYNRVNAEYADMRTVLNRIDDITGKTFDPLSGEGTSEIGQAMRGIYSNRGKRSAIQKAIIELQRSANQYGSKSYDADLVALTGVTDMIEDTFGTQAVNSLQGQTQKAVEQGGLNIARRLKNSQGFGDLALDVAGEIADAASPKGDDAVYAAKMERLELLRTLLE